MQGIFLGSYTVTIIHTILLCIILWFIKRGHFYIDATNIWRQVSNFEKEGYFFLGADIIIFVILIVVMVFSLVLRYEGS